MWVLAARRLGETEIPRGLRLEHGDWHTRHEPRKKAGARMVALKLRALDGSGDSHPEMLCELVVLTPVMPFDTWLPQPPSGYPDFGHGGGIS